MILTEDLTKQQARRLARIIRKDKTPVEWILYCHPERDILPASLLAVELAYPLVSAASPILLRTFIPPNSLLFSVLADAVLFDIWDALTNTLRATLPTASFYKQIDDPTYWLDILPHGGLKWKWY